MPSQASCAFRPLAVIETAATRGLLGAERARVLVNAYRLFSDVTQILRLTLDPGTDPRAANEAVKRRLAKVAGQPGISGLESCLADNARRGAPRFR